MPELPEVEVTAAALRPALVGGRLAAWSFSGKRLRHPFPKRALHQLIGEPVVSVGRRAKYVLLEFPSGWLAIHLGMSGSLQCHVHRPAPEPHDHVRLTFDRSGHEATAVFHDPRRFGSVQWIARADLGEQDIGTRLGSSARGCEPLDPQCNGAALYARSRGRKTPIKQWLMAGDAVVGVGNIYACEALFAAEIHPRRKVGTVSLAKFNDLVAHLRRILSEAIAQGGSTISDFIGPDGRAGRYGQAHRVYGQEGTECPRCGPQSGFRIRRIVQQQRSTFYCHGCQR